MESPLKTPALISIFQEKRIILSDKERSVPHTKAYTAKQTTYLIRSTAPPQNKQSLENDNISEMSSEQ